MKNNVNYMDLSSNSKFIMWFLSCNFPEAIDSETDYSLSEIIQENCVIDKKFIDDLTGYYEGVFEENDGYIDHPKCISFDLHTGERYCIEFHPGDTIYYINDMQIGCTGPDYSIKHILLSKFLQYTKDLSEIEKFYLLPMIKIIETEKKDALSLVKTIVNQFDLQGCNVDKVCECIVENCLEVMIV